MVTRIRQTRPDIKLTWIIGRIEYELVKGLQGVDFMVYDKRGNKTYQKNFVQELKQHTFDVLCIMQVALRANWLSRHVRASIKIGFDKTHSKEGHSLFINRRISPLTHPHVIQGFDAFADAMNIPAQSPRQWHLPLDKDDELISKALLEKYASFIAVCPAASKAERSWSPQGYAEVIDYCQRRGSSVVLCGGPGALDKLWEKEIVARCETSLHSLVGQTSLKQLASVLKQAKCVIAPDTGPAHMAAVLGTPVIGLYAHSNPRRTGPVGDIHTLINHYDQHVADQRGKNWHELRWGTRAKGQDLMNTITSEEVIKAVSPYC